MMRLSLVFAALLLIVSCATNSKITSASRCVDGSLATNGCTGSGTTIIPIVQISPAMTAIVANNLGYKSSMGAVTNSGTLGKSYLLYDSTMVQSGTDLTRGTTVSSQGYTELLAKVYEKRYIATAASVGKAVAYDSSSNVMYDASITTVANMFPNYAEKPKIAMIAGGVNVNMIPSNASGTGAYLFNQTAVNGVSATDVQAADWQKLVNINLQQCLLGGCQTVIDGSTTTGNLGQYTSANQDSTFMAAIMVGRPQNYSVSTAGVAQFAQLTSYNTYTAQYQYDFDKSGTVNNPGDLIYTQAITDAFTNAASSKIRTTLFAPSFQNLQTYIQSGGNTFASAMVTDVANAFNSYLGSSSQNLVVVPNGYFSPVTVANTDKNFYSTYGANVNASLLKNSDGTQNYYTAGISSYPVQFVPFVASKYQNQILVVAASDIDPVTGVQYFSSTSRNCGSLSSMCITAPAASNSYILSAQSDGTVKIVPSYSAGVDPTRMAAAFTTGIISNFRTLHPELDGASTIQWVKDNAIRTYGTVKNASLVTDGTTYDFSQDAVRRGITWQVANDDTSIKTLLTNLGYESVFRTLGLLGASETIASVNSAKLITLQQNVGASDILVTVDSTINRYLFNGIDATITFNTDGSIKNAIKYGCTTSSYDCAIQSNIYGWGNLSMNALFNANSISSTLQKNSDSITFGYTGSSMQTSSVIGSQLLLSSQFTDLLSKINYNYNINGLSSSTQTDLTTKTVNSYNGLSSRLGLMFEQKALAFNSFGFSGLSANFGQQVQFDGKNFLYSNGTIANTGEYGINSMRNVAFDQNYGKFNLFGAYNTYSISNNLGLSENSNGSVYSNFTGFNYFNTSSAHLSILANHPTNATGLAYKQDNFVYGASAYNVRQTTTSQYSAFAGLVNFGVSNKTTKSIGSIGFIKENNGYAGDTYTGIFGLNSNTYFASYNGSKTLGLYSISGFGSAGFTKVSAISGGIFDSVSNTITTTYGFGAAKNKILAKSDNIFASFIAPIGVSNNAKVIASTNYGTSVTSLRSAGQYNLEVGYGINTPIKFKMLDSYSLSLSYLNSINNNLTNQKQTNYMILGFKAGL